MSGGLLLSTTFPNDERRGRFLVIALWSLGSLAGCGIASGSAPEDSLPDWERQVAPIVATHCLECHNANDSKGGLDLSTRASMLSGGGSGPALEPGKPDESYLLERVRAGEMPPKKQSKRPLDEREIELLVQWIGAGANWSGSPTLSPYSKTSDVRAGLDWWSLRPVRRPPVPAVAARERVANPIDAFLLARLEAEGRTMAPPAGRRVLARRLYADLTGVPPTPAQMAEFLSDTAPDAYDRLVDRLLGSARFGERWARPWLDLVRFAETNGYERDATKPNAWKYRDWVIAALNGDKPYDRFVTEQLAGDELPDRDERTVVATGFLRVGTWDDEPNDPLEYKYERLDDLVHVTSTAFMGLTVRCARCHDHKFDPIPQTDYYRLASVFWAGFIEPRDRALMGGPSKEELGYAVLGWTDRGREVPPLHVLKKGDPRRPGPVIEPAYPSLVPARDKPFSAPTADAPSTGRRLQLARWITEPDNPLTARIAVNRIWQGHFGEGLVRTPDNLGFKGDQPTHPLLLDWLADELVAGGWRAKRIHRLVLTSDAYRMASAHPRQEEYEQVDFANHGWWRQNRRRLDAEALRDAMLAVGGDLVDAMGGPSFYPRIESAALEGLSRKGATWGKSGPAERSRRSIYIFTKRSLLLPLMTTFDFCDTTKPTGQRNVTTVAPQALALLNNRFVHDVSEAFARRVVAEAGADPARRIERAWRLAFGRAPSKDEQSAALAYLSEQRTHFDARLGDGAARSTETKPVDLDHLTLASLCHVLLNANEFLYLD